MLLEASTLAWQEVTPRSAREALKTAKPPQQQQLGWGGVDGPRRDANWLTWCYEPGQ